MAVNLSIDHDRVEVRIQGKQNICECKLVETLGGVSFKYVVEGYQKIIPVYSWCQNGKYYLSDRPNDFTIPGGKLRKFDICKYGLLKEII